MISQTAEYALRAVYCLGASTDRLVTSQEISKSMDIPGSYLSKVLGALARAGVVRSQRGPSGGFRLIREPADLSLFEIIEAVEPWKRIDKCPIGHPDHSIDLCPLHSRLRDAWLQVEDAFRTTTLAEILQPHGDGRPDGG
jgi:Rrf2 family protein